MGLKCSLFGHSYDERDTVQERESKGSEVVTVVKEVERCTECGATRIVSTNKEVVSTAGATADGGVSTGTTLRTPGDGPAGSDDAFETPDQLGTGAPGGPGAATTGGSETAAAATTPGQEAGGSGADGNNGGGAGAFDTGSVESTAGGAGGSAGTAAPDTGEDEGVELMTDPGADAPDPGDVDPGPEPADAGEAVADTADDDDPVTEDAEILTDEPAPDRAPGQWPGDEASEAWEPEPLTRDDADDDGTDDDGTDAAEAAEAAEAGADAADAGGASDTEAAPDEPESAEILDGSDDSDAGSTPETTAEPAPDIEPEPAATASFTVPEGHYRCPECGHTIPAESSFRRGDACPECVHGYLEASE